MDAAVDTMLDDTFSETTRVSGPRVSETVFRKPPGTINYMAPELFEGAATTPSVDDVCFLAPASRKTRSARLLTRCDAWSFAMTAYETVTGSVPWRGLTPTQIVELVGVKDERPRGLGPGPERVSDWLGDADASDRKRKIFAAAFHEHLVGKCVEKCWARDPHDRPLVHSFPNLAGVMREKQTVHPACQSPFQKHWCMPTLDSLQPSKTFESSVAREQESRHGRPSFGFQSAASCLTKTPLLSGWKRRASPILGIALTPSKVLFLHHQK